MQISLDGIWEYGVDHQLCGTTQVPGLTLNPHEVTPGTLWYRRQVTLPAGDWTGATLTLNGARFCPTVFVNGDKVSSTPGGMTMTTHLLDHPAVLPGATISLVISLLPLDKVDAQDASRIPAADFWRSNISSCLWDSVILRTHGDSRLTHVIPFYDLHTDTLTVKWSAEGPAAQLRVQICTDEAVLAEMTAAGDVAIPLNGVCKLWTPDSPTCYTLRATLLRDGVTEDQQEFTWAPKEFRIEGKQFRLNDLPVTFRSGSVVWHRWVRDPEARELAWDTAWFERNIVQRLKEHGANGLRFHLGMPPEALLDLCDRHGLLAQVEWSFFHGMKASGESLVAQWRDWFDLCMRHPCVAIIHPWNETEGDELDIAFAAIAQLAPEYPQLVISHRDTLHVHKYWWGLFENLGLYYDSAEQFPQPIVVDEFGGNYLDGECNPGGYPALKESFLRFLGRGHTKELRLQLHTEANTQVAEYWRRLGVAGFSPFCILGSPEDGNHHFLGPLRDARPKPVWDGLTAAYAPQSCSLDLWDRNFLPGQQITLPLYFFNETAKQAQLIAEARIVPENSSTACCGTPTLAMMPVDAWGQERTTITIPAPHSEGEWRVEVQLQNPTTPLPYPIVSSWRIRTLTPQVPAALAEVVIGVPEEEAELREFLASFGIKTVAMTDSNAQIIVTSESSWENIAAKRTILWEALERGKSLLMLDIGPRDKGNEYLQNGDLGPLQGGRWIEKPEVLHEELFGGISLDFREMAEAESCLHPAADDASLWQHLPQQATWLWNGLRLVAPAYDVAAVGLNPDAFIASWVARGADAELIKGAEYLAYELAGFYAFATKPDDAVMAELRQRVRFLVEDAPALAISINPNAPIITRNLAELYAQSSGGQAETLTPLANCGKNLSRTPVVEISFGATRGKLILSQLFTAGRLSPEFDNEGHYGIRNDPAAQQFVLNMLGRLVC